MDISTNATGVGTAFLRELLRFGLFGVNRSDITSTELELPG